MTTLVLIHGLGATPAVWGPMIETASCHWDGEILAPGLCGHAGGPWRDRYRLDDFTHGVARSVGDRDCVVLGHSLGGVIALALASGAYGPMPQRVLGLGVKVVWTEEEAAGLAKRATAPAKPFATRDEAIERYLKASGLVGLIDPASAMATSGVAETPAGWRLACDPRTGEVGPPPMDALCAQATAPFALACGDRDPMVSVDQLRRWDANARALESLGHNAMVEDPAAVWRWVKSVTALTPAWRREHSS